MSKRLNDSNVSAFLIVIGREFHRVGPATENALEPVLVFTRGTKSLLVAIETFSIGGQCLYSKYGMVDILALLMVAFSYIIFVFQPSGLISYLQ